MNWYSVLGAAIIGGAAGGLSSLLADRLLKPGIKHREQIKLAVTVVAFFIATGLGNRLILPHISKYEYRTQLEQGLGELKGMPVFAYIKKYDPGYYDTVMNDLSLLIAKNESRSKEEIQLICNEYGKQMSARYYKRSSDEAILNYSKNFIRFMKDIQAKDPDILCRFLFPGQFGPFQSDLMTDLQSGKDLFVSMEDIFKTGSRNNKPPDDALPAKLVDKYRTEFVARYPGYSKLFDALDTVKTAEQKKELGTGVIIFYEGVVKKPVKESAPMMRNMFSGT